MDDIEVLTSKLKAKQILTEEEINEIASHFELEKISKNQYFLEAGNRCSRLGFLKSGIFCTFIYNEEGEEVVKYFLEDHQFFTDLESYSNEKPANLNIQAMIDSEVLFIRKSINDELEARIPNWGHVIKIFAAEALNEMIQKQNFLHFGSAVDQYNYFLEHHPKLARHVPLKYIASYLGITQSSLSRIRRQQE